MYKIYYWKQGESTSGADQNIPCCYTQKKEKEKVQQVMEELIPVPVLEDREHVGLLQLSRLGDLS